MSRSDWRKFGKTIGLTSAAFFLLALLYVVGFYTGNASGFYEGQAQTTAHQYPSDTKRIVDECFKLPTRAAASECVSEAQASSQENQRAEHDLKAQRDMSDWAWWVMVVGALQFFATIATLGFVKLTLDATLEAVKDTGDATNAMLRQNEISELAHRPWVKLTVEEKANFRPILVADVATQRTIQVSVKAKNFGQSPAIFPTLVVKIFRMNGYVSRELIEKVLRHHAVLNGLPEEAIFPGEERVIGDDTSYGYPILDSQKGEPTDISSISETFVAVGLFYKGTSSDSLHMTSKILMCHTPHGVREEEYALGERPVLIKDFKVFSSTT